MIPYKKLYIYEIDGRVSREDNDFPTNYIGTWWEGEHSFLFFCQEAEGIIQSLLSREPSLCLIGQYTIDYQVWQGGDEIRIFRVGKMVFIPAWVEVTPEPDEIPIILDPCVVFGTGLHPTTRGCLEMLWEVFRRDRPRSVLDLGTGTGILAIASAKLGAERVLAIDHNPLAVKTARKNVVRNREERRIAVIEGNAEDLIGEGGDLVCCNLHYLVLDRLLNEEAFFRKRWIILSGFFEREGKGIAQRLQRRGVGVKTIAQHESWQTILGFNPEESAVS
ncbi:MAG: methyltransferase domain-containing protein [Proteobacteria bacterium]|nr:methyltransferase domain-containing protein [Pseudomonadota bacterium]NIS68242.1 methyltransferase domain-containing protein [Pseudomonadota bacterium]